MILEVKYHVITSLVRG